MFIILRNRSYRNLNPNFLLLRSKSPIAPFSSLKSSSESNPNPNPTSELVKGLFRSHGFTETQISKIIKKRPQIFSANPDIIAPKFDFLISIGIPKTDLPKVILYNSSILTRSLKNLLIPSHNSLKSFLGNDENVVKMLRHRSRILLLDFEKRIAPNINLLAEIGVPKTLIKWMMVRSSDVFCNVVVKFKMHVKAAIKMGFTATDITDALQVIGDMGKVTWNRKVMTYKSWGLSDTDVQTAFRLHPYCMSYSKEKITEAMDFFVNEMGRKAVDVVRKSHMFGYNIENRIKPRCRVIKLLISKGFVKKTMSLSHILALSETQFVEQFVIKYVEKVPELLSIYQQRQKLKT